MSRSLFDQSFAPRHANRRPIGTVMLSVLLHAAALVVIVVLQITSAMDGAALAQSVPMFVAPNPIEPIVPPRPPAEVRAPSPAIATSPIPLQAPETFTPEPVSPAPPSLGGVPGALNIGPPGEPGGLFKGAETITALAPPPPLPPPVVRAGGDLRPPARIWYVEPVYPQSARIAKIEGVVILEATIDPTGAVTNVVVLRSQPLLDRAAVEAVSRWRYTPSFLNGQAVSVVMSVTVRFSLR